jgi:hypothetical protein
MDCLCWTDAGRSERVHSLGQAEYRWCQWLGGGVKLGLIVCIFMGIYGSSCCVFASSLPSSTLPSVLHIYLESCRYLILYSLSLSPSKSRLVRLSTIVSASRPDSHLPRCQFHSRPTAPSFPVTIRLQRYQTGFSLHFIILHHGRHRKIRHSKRASMVQHGPFSGRPLRRT